MTDIILPKNWTSNEFGIVSAIYALIAYCIYPMDGNKRDETTKVLNIEVLLKIKYDFPSLEEQKSELETSAKKQEFWDELKEFGKKNDFELPPNLAEILTPGQCVDEIKSVLVKLASDSLDLPENIERFLLHAPTPDAIKDEWRGETRKIATAFLIVFKIMQMQKHKPDVRGGASLKKAIELLTCKKGSAPIKNSTDIRKAWDVHKKSVHIAMGLMMAHIALTKTDLIKEHNKGKGYINDYCSPIFVGVALVFAKAFQDWLLSFKLSRHTPTTTATRLIKPKQLWTIPTKGNSFDYASKLVALLPEFDEQELACLEGKRS